MDDITVLLKGENREVAEVAKKVMKKLIEEIEKKALKVSVTENGKIAEALSLVSFRTSFLPAYLYHNVHAFWRKKKTAFPQNLDQSNKGKHHITRSPVTSGTTRTRARESSSQPDQLSNSSKGSSHERSSSLSRSPP